MNTITKQAAGESKGGSQEFEQAFFQLAYDKLQSRLFNLLPFLVGFELVKKSENNSKAVGVFGFKSGNGQILFVPAFFVNGKVKDMDIMYSRNNNQFYPLNEDFAELFLKDDVTGLGAPAKDNKKDIEKDTNKMNMQNVIYPPRTGRITYASVKNDDEFCLLMNKTAAELVDQPFDPAIKSASLLQFVQDCGPSVQDGLWDLLEKDAEFADAIRHFYSDEEIAAALTKQSAVKLKEKAKLKVVRFSDKKDHAGLDGKAVGELTGRGYSILDSRPDTEVSKVGLFKYTETFSNPSEAGFYPYITEMGMLRYGVVLIKPEQLYSGFSSDQAIVIDLEAERTGQAYIVETKDLFIKDQVRLPDFSSIHKLLEEPAESLPGFDEYIMINDELACTQPFRIVENFKDSSGIRRLKVQPTGGEYSVSKGPRAIVLVLTKRAGNKLEHRNHAVYVPKNFKLLKIDTSEYFCQPAGEKVTDYKKRQAEEEKERAQIRCGRPGGLHHLDSYLREKNVFPMTVQTNGSEYFLSVDSVKTKYPDSLACKIGMVTDIGLDEEQADTVLSKIASSQPLNGMIKIAYLGDQTFQLQDETPYSNELGQPTYSGVPYIEQADMSDGYTGDPTQLGLGVKPDQEQVQHNVQNATQLAQSGQKEIFDTQSIATLAKYSRPNDKIMDYVPDFVSSLDKLGRLLFMCSWNTDELQKLYGRDELPEMCALIKTVFDGLGDLVIFLKRKTPDLSINRNDQDSISSDL